MAIKYSELVESHGEAKAAQIGTAICGMHGGMSFYDFKTHRGGIDISGCSQDDQDAIASLIEADRLAPEEVEVKPLTRMTKAELVAEAERLGLSVTPDSMTNRQIIEVIETYNAQD